MMPSLRELEKMWRELLPVGVMQEKSKKEAQKIIRNVSKTTLQVLAVKDRIALINCFLNPPPSHADKFTLKLLGALRTDKEVNAFWKWYDSLSV